jgi:ABC-2 type transport system ATP-binding protein
MDNAIELEDVCKSFKKQKVLNDLNLEIPTGRITCLIGPSGCGKTTAIRIINGSLPRDSGRRSVLGSDSIDFDILHRIGYMSQDDKVYTGLTGRENLYFFGRLGGLKGSALKKRSEELAELLLLANDLDKLASNYSGGMKRRLSLAIAMMHSPELLVLDEPTVGLAPLLRNEIWKELRRLSDQAVTILLSTHVMDEVERCDIAALMRAGKIMATGAPHAIVETARTRNLEEAFILYSKQQKEGDAS